MKRREDVRKIVAGYIRQGVDTLRGPLTAEEVEKELAEAEKRFPDEKEPLILGGPRWDQMRARLKQGDELYFYRSDADSWAQLLGSEGYVVIRENKVVDTLLTVIN